MSLKQSEKTQSVSESAERDFDCKITTKNRPLQIWSRFLNGI